MLLLPASLERRSASHSQMLENVHHERAVVVEKYASQTHTHKHAAKVRQIREPQSAQHSTWWLA